MNFQLIHEWKMKSKGKLVHFPLFKVNKNKNMTYQNLWNAIKAALGRKSGFWNAYINKKKGLKSMT